MTQRCERQVGESWTFGFDPAELPAYLQQHGLVLLRDVGSVEYRTRYLGSTGRHLHGYTFYRAALAEVGPYSASGVLPPISSAESLQRKKR